MRVVERLDQQRPTGRVADKPQVLGAVGSHQKAQGTDAPQQASGTGKGVAERLFVKPAAKVSLPRLNQTEVLREPPE